MIYKVEVQDDYSTKVFSFLKIFDFKGDRSQNPKKYFMDIEECHFYSDLNVLSKTEEVKILWFITDNHQLQSNRYIKVNRSFL